MKTKYKDSTERYHEITEILKKFENGDELFQRSPLFNTAVQMMVDDVDVYYVLERVVEIAERTSRAFEDYVNRDTRPLIHNGQKYYTED